MALAAFHYFSHPKRRLQFVVIFASIALLFLLTFELSLPSHFFLLDDENDDEIFSPQNTTIILSVNISSLPPQNTTIILSVNISSTKKSIAVKKKEVKYCELYDGKWVKDEEGHYPLYEPDTCPYLDEVFSCKANGREDEEYLRWRWKPNDCDLPRFNATDFLERLRGKRLVLVGDSLNRNQFESIVCLLREALPDKNKSKLYETPGHEVLRGRDYFSIKFMDYNCTIEYVQSRFLVKKGSYINKKKGLRAPLLTIDTIDDSASQWRTADILIFNTGHWWTKWKLAMRKTHYKVGKKVYPEFNTTMAFTRALRTWGKWIDENMDPVKSMVFYRTYSTSHFRGGDWNSGGSCSGETEPIMSGPMLDKYPALMKIVEGVIHKMRFPVILMNVTKLTNFRRDGHPSIYRTKEAKYSSNVSGLKQDCSHWCLPGVPDSWNELMYATIVLRNWH